MIRTLNYHETTAATLSKIQRVRDPVHGLISFGESKDRQVNRRDQCAWKLLNTPEFQRLRRIRQLGVSEFTFPGASHTRFSHSIGVFHTARKLSELIENRSDDFDLNRAHVAVLASLVHDLGHGPFSHAFENAQESRGAQKSHENWTSDIILHERGKVFPVLEEFDEGISAKVARLLRSDSPQDEYHAIVSSSFDADRLDYLRRDRLMTGSGAGAIDFDWLIDNIRVDSISIAPDDEDEDDASKIRTFCIDEKAIQAAESFLLARYHLFSQVYLHKTTRSMEVVIGNLFKAIAQYAKENKPEKIGLSKDDPLVLFFRPDGEILENYLQIDDYVVWAAVHRISQCKELPIAKFAARFIQRRPLKCIDVNQLVPIEPHETFEEVNARRLKKAFDIDAYLGDKLGKIVFKDAEPISIYGEIGADESKRHKKLSIRLAPGVTKEITQLSPTIKTLAGKRSVVRYFFLKESDRNAVWDTVR